MIMFLGHGTKHTLYFQVTGKVIRYGMRRPFDPTKALQEGVQRSIKGGTSFDGS
jgi:hypothetical protein